MHTEHPPTMELHIKNFPSDLNERAKHEALRQRITLKALIIKAIERLCDETK